MCDTPAAASYWESYYAAHYGLPTACFHGDGRSLAMGEDLLEKLFHDLDTERPAKQLMADLLLHPDFPHHRPQGGARRQSINLTMSGGSPTQWA